MLLRKSLRPNNQAFVPASGAQWFSRFPKAVEQQSIHSWSKPGKGQQGESVTGTPYQSQVIRKGQSRAT